VDKGSLVNSLTLSSTPVVCRFLNLDERFSGMGLSKRDIRKPDMGKVAYQSDAREMITWGLEDPKFQTD